MKKQQQKEMEQKDNKFNVDAHKRIDKVIHLAAPTPAELTEIFEVYKLYVNPNATTFNNYCNGCNGSIQAMWRDVVIYYNQNRSKFEPI